MQCIRTVGTVTEYLNVMLKEGLTNLLAVGYVIDAAAVVTAIIVIFASMTFVLLAQLFIVPIVIR